MPALPRSGLLALALAPACGPPDYAKLEPIEGGPVDSADALPELDARPPLRDPARFLRRASLDLTGHLPEPTTLDRLADDPSQLDDELAALLDHPALEDRLVHLLDERWHLRFEGMPVGPPDYGLAPELRYTLARDMAEEPLRLMARVVASDASWDRVVQSDETLATPLLTEVWPLERTGDPDALWSTARWTDHRPAVGVLASNGLWWRYNTTAFNYNRTRAAAVSRLVLCDDYLDLAIEFESPSLTDADGTEAAIRTNASCVACHATLDPMAAVFFGFWAYDLYDPLELSRYHPEREPLSMELLGVEPAWFGTPIDSLQDLATVVPADPRFPICAVETFTAALWRRAPVPDDRDVMGALLRQFEATDRRVGPLLLALTATPTYVGDLADTPTATARPRILGAQQLATLLAQTLGFDWTHDGEDQLDSDTTGLRVALGGVDGEEVTAPKRDPDANLALAWRAVSQAAGQHAVTSLETGSCALLPGATLATTPDSAEFRPALRHAVHWLTAQPPTDMELDALADLWWATAAVSPRDGWAAVVSALLQDPLVVTY